MRRALLAALPVFALCAAAAGGSAVEGGGLSRCPPRKHRLLIANQSAVVYLGVSSFIERLESASGGYEHFRETVPEILGCARGAHQRSVALGEPVHSTGSAAGETAEGVRREALGGAIVAYEDFTEGCGLQVGAEREGCGARWYVVVRDLRTGRRLRRVPTGAPRPGPPDPSYVGIGPTTKIVVAPNGAVAWIVSAERGEGFYQLHAVDSTGGHVLAIGNDIAPHSLALHGHEVSWTQGGVRRSATLG